MSNDSHEPKIVVDDDWKERVRAEREAARAARHAAHPTAEADPGQAGSQAAGREPDEFALLVSMLASQALVALGRMPDPVQGHAVVRPDHAKQAIGTLTMLQEKTQGNLTTEETQMLDQLLHDLRMLYLEVYKTPKSDTPSTGPDPASPAESP
jgi:hypothetical protein